MEQPPQYETIQPIPSWAIPWVVSEESIEYNGKTYPYALMKKEMFTAVPGFVGYPNTEFLFISEATPKEYIRTELIHEIICCNSQGVGRCKKALEKELSLVDEHIKREYITYRTKVYEALVAYYEKDEHMKELYQEISTTHKALLELSTPTTD
jgi:hypothetical protein